MNSKIKEAFDNCVEFQKEYRDAVEREAKAQSDLDEGTCRYEHWNEVCNRKDAKRVLKEKAEEKLLEVMQEEIDNYSI